MAGSGRVGGQSGPRLLHGDGVAQSVRAPPLPADLPRVTTVGPAGHPRRWEPLQKLKIRGITLVREGENELAGNGNFRLGWPVTQYYDLLLNYDALLRDIFREEYSPRCLAPIPFSPQ